MSEPLEELKQAMMKDFEQRCIDSLTPDRGYDFPTENVRAIIVKLAQANDQLRSELAMARQHEDEWQSVGLLISERDRLKAEVERLKGES
jgi:hypothetical protein